MPVTLWMAEQRVNTTTTGAQLSPHVTQFITGGDILVVWSDQGSGAGDIRLQRFTAGGARSGSEIAVSSDPATENDPFVTVLPDGNFRVAWEFGSGIAQRMYSANSVPMSAPSIIYSQSADVRSRPTINVQSFDVA